MANANPLWGAPRIHGELLKLGIDDSEATVAKYLPRRRRPPSPSWRTFLTSHVSQIAAADFFVVPTVTFRLLYVLIILSHERRRLVHVAVTAHPTAVWTAQQLREAFPNDEAPRFLVHDRDSTFAAVGKTVESMGIQEVRTAPRSPWQNSFAERVIGSIRRECLDHVIVLNERGLRRVFYAYVAYYHTGRTHMSLEKDTRFHDRSHHVVASSPSRTSVGCIIATTVWQRKLPWRHSPTPEDESPVAGTPKVRAIGTASVDEAARDLRSLSDRKESQPEPP